MTSRRFSKRILLELGASQALHIRAGRGHRYLYIWVVVVKGRAFVRPWNDKPTGWRQAFLVRPTGGIQIGEGGRKVSIRARAVGGERLNDAVDDAYAAKYSSAANRKWVRGLKSARRRKTTMELLPL